MSIHSGTLSALEIGKIYNVGFAYAKNIVDKLEEIGYIKKRTEIEYSMIQTEQAIDAYIRENFKDFRPSHYDSLELKDDGKPTVKAKAKKAKKSAPMFMCRVFASPFSVIFTLLAMYSGIQAKANIEEILYTSLMLLLVFCSACNIGYGLIVSKRKGMKFTEYMLRPWITERVRTVSEIHDIMRKSNVKFKVTGYYETLRLLKIHLSAKKKLAEHYAEMANNAETENEFHQSINSCLEVLEWMSQFEKYEVYGILEEPSEDIKKIKEGMPISIERFNNRMKSAGKVAVYYDYMEGHDFEYFCADILRKNGYANVEVTQGSGDHGVDILAEKDDITYAIQCKCYSSDIGNAAVQQAHTGKSIYKRDIAVVLTNRYFTPQAKEEARALGVKLWDRDKLNSMIEKA